MRGWVAAALVAAGCAGGPPKAGRDNTTLGLSKATAIEVCMGAGEREYLDRLRCADGSKPALGKRTNAGIRQPADAPKGGFNADTFRNSMDPNRRLEPGERDPHIVDRYKVRCGKEEMELYLDMYHCAAAGPREAPPGLLLAPEP